jgi:uncharacterized protein (TIGR02996 family)
VTAEPYDWPCPVCDGTTSVWRDISRLDYYGPVLEESCWCDCGGWRTEYHYGASEEYVGPHEWYGDQTVGDWQLIMGDARRVDKALAAACRLAPEDAAPRLVLADWCDENDMPEWAAFWRAQAARLLEKVASASA